MKLIISNTVDTLVQQHIKGWEGCTQCEIGRLTKNHVFARGTIPCEVLFIGEGPGRNEDKEGYPFVGAAGRILDYWINSLKLRFFTYAITNTVLRRPNDKNGPNRPPTELEITNCTPRLLDFITLCQPHTLVILGREAEYWYIEHCLKWSQHHLALVHPASCLYSGGKRGIASTKAASQLQEFLLARFKAICEGKWLGKKEQ